jgi:hypothetical protein
MDYEDRIDLVKANLPDEVSRRVGKMYLEYKDRDGFFMCWIQMDSNAELPDIYVGEFKRRFGEHITSNIEQTIRLVAGTMCHALKAYVDTYEDKIVVKKLTEFVRNFVTEQVEDFGNWCEEVCQAMYVESDDDGVAPDQQIAADPI